MRTFILTVLLLTLALIMPPRPALGQKVSLEDSIKNLSRDVGGTVGVAAKSFDKKVSFQVNGQAHFPMQSVMKFPLALAVLHRVDQGILALSQKVHLSKADLSTPTFSPIRDKYPEGDVDLTIDSLLRYTVSQSDNIGCDKLFQILGGPGAVNDYVHQVGVKEIQIVATEKQMGQDWQTQYRNWCSPNAMLRLLELFQSGSLLSKNSHDYLWQLLLETVNAPNRIRGLLPANAVVAHKPGTSGVNAEGIAAATNDVGIIELPNQQRFAVAILVSNATAALPDRERTIAHIARLFWNCWQ
ncbi:MAG: class A beta-lactamase, subclass A2 [Mucilaginibacter sp.]|nr:class A beta-lactamase, subclass A2 [Mucilaginibacter sp.]